MYSQPWSPTPSTTAVAPELRTAKRSPAMPLKNASPLVAPYEHHVADQDVLFRQEGGAARRIDDQRAARESLADVVVGIAFQLERHALGQERAEALPGRAVELEADGVVRQARRSRSAARFRRESIAPTVRCTLRMGSLISTGVPFSRASLRVLDQLVIERLRRGRGPARCTQRRATRLRHRRIVEDRREVEALAPSSDRWPCAHSSMSTRPDHLVEACGSPAAPCTARTCSAMKKKKLMTCSGCALELLAQRRILRGDAHRTGVQVALAHHDAAHGDQRRGGEAELLGAQQRGDGDVAAGLQLAVGLHADAAAQIVQHQHLLRFGQPELPRDARVLDGAERRGAGAAAIAR